jgi:hypothetical protein
MQREPHEEEEEKLPRDFDLPVEHLEPDDSSSDLVQAMLEGRVEVPEGYIRLSPEDFIIIASTISLYSSYVSYVREMDEGLHRRAVEFSSDTVELHPNVVLTDGDGNPIGRFAENAEETGADDDPPVGI